MLELTLNWQVHDHTHSHTVRVGQDVSLGRRDDCDIVLPFATISRRHAQIYSEGGRFFIRNLSQTNSVRVNDDDRLIKNQPNLIPVMLSAWVQLKSTSKDWKNKKISRP